MRAYLLGAWGAVATMLSVGLNVGMADDVLPEGAKPLSAILQQLEGQGISQIKEANFDDGVWEIEGMRGANGVDLKVDAKLGTIIHEKADRHTNLPPKDQLSVSAIARALENEGYAPIYELDWKTKHWEAEATFKSQRHKVLVNPTTGKVISSRRDD